ncbi:MAG TPA: hypothetical protein VD767_08350 [Thermomicrobiales bacterium]|nr:hypothetical protein [Thermomicrobiales bacterium]
MQRSRSIARHRFLAWLLALLVTLGSVAAFPNVTSAQYYDVHSNAPFEQLTGLQFAGQRLYQGSNELNIYIDVAVFDTEANAAAGLTALNTYYLDSYAAAASPIPFEPADPPAEVPDALAYLGYLDIGTGPYGEVALVQVQDGTTVLIAFVSNYAYDSNPEELAMEVAGAMLDSILQVPVATATPAAIDPASVLARLPLETGEVPASYGMTYAGDTEWFAPEASGEPTVAAEADEPALLYGDAEGLVLVIGRDYDEPDDDSIDALGAYIEIAEFDSDEHAEAAFAIAEASLVDEIESSGLAFEETDLDVSADASRAWAGTLDEDTVQALVITRDGNLMISVATFTSDVDVARELAADLAQATIDADAGDSDAQFDDFGGSTGGLWDKLPSAGDDVLQGMEPAYDETLYP